MNVQSIFAGGYNIQPMKAVRTLKQNVSFSGYQTNPGIAVAETSPFFNEKAAYMPINLEVDRILGLARRVGDYSNNPDNPNVRYIGDGVMNELLGRLDEKRNNSVKLTGKNYYSQPEKQQYKMDKKFVRQALKEIEKDYERGKPDNRGINLNA